MVADSTYSVYHRWSLAVHHTVTRAEHAQASLRPVFEPSNHLLAGADARFESAVDSLVTASSPIERHRAGVDAVAATLGSPESTSLFPARYASATGYRELLSFFERVGARMLDDRTDWRWTAESVGEINVGGGP